jgi:DNA helicase-4
MYLTHDKRTHFLSHITKQIKYTESTVKKDKYEKFQKQLQTVLKMKRQIEQYNDHHIEKNRKLYGNLFKTSYGSTLDREQQNAILHDDTYNLVVAGAGSGKTEVLIRKIAYLCKRKVDKINPQRILALAFQKEAAQEMRKRLQHLFNIDIDIKTFHALGKTLCPHAHHVLQEQDQKKRITGLYKSKLSTDPAFRSMIIDYGKHIKDPRILHKENFTTKQEYYAYMRNLKLTTLDNTIVKSEFERHVMNFFLTHKLNGREIQIRYEAPAKWMAYTAENGNTRDPTPDFFFPELNLYLECWALNSENRVPEWFEGKNATQTYKENMQKKIDQFKNQEKYKLLEIKYKDYQENPDFEKHLIKLFLSFLNEKYPGIRHTIQKMSYQEIIEKAWYEYKKSIENISNDIFNFISVAKTYGLKPRDIHNRITQERWSPKQIKFAHLALIIYEEYENRLAAENTIDFADMINMAVTRLDSDPNLLANTYDYILIDEYQDISDLRYKLIHAVIQHSPEAKLFAVGDDWQSIMGFTGSNLNYFVKFADYFPHPCVSMISTNYRSNQTIVNCGASVMINNGATQITKKPVAKNKNEGIINVIQLTRDPNRKEKNERQEKDKFLRSMSSCCTDLIKHKLEEGYTTNDILLLSRNRKGYWIYKYLLDDCDKNNIMISLNKKYLNNAIQLMTVHQSKGLQARCIIMLDITSGLYGFPSQIQDPDILNPATLHAFNGLEEERRLFYVALTRATEEIHIYTQTENLSPFIEEIEDFATYTYKFY